MGCATPSFGLQPCSNPQAPKPHDSRASSNDSRKIHEHKILNEHPLTLYVVGRLTTLCLDKPVLHTVGATVLDKLPDQPAEKALMKLQSRRSYIAKAPYQRKTKWKALRDKGLKLCPASWLGPTILKAHDKHQYKKDRQHTQEVFVEWQEKRGRSGKSTIVNSVVGLETHLAPLEHNPLVEDDGRDPWALPSIEEMT